MQLSFGYTLQLRILAFGMALLITAQNSIAQGFENATSEARLNLVLLAGNGTNSVSAADYNNDGFLDLYFVVPLAYSPSNKGTWNLLYAGTEDGSFREVNSNVGVYGKGENIKSYMGKKLGASWGDFDNDGYPDLFLTNAGPDQLLHNNGDGTFTDITASAGVAGGPTQFSSTALWFDYDSDGDLDLYISIWEDYMNGERNIKNRMYENTGNGTFSDVSEASSLNDGGKTWMAVAIDVNNDGLLDLYLANDFGENKLYINHQNKMFTEESESYGLNDKYEGMGLAIGDVNNDGLFDIYVTNATEKPFNEEQINPLFINSGENFFENKSAETGVELAGWGWGTEFFDYNNDGWEDLFVVNGYFESSIDSNRFFKNISTPDSIAFVEVAEELGINDVAESRSFLPFDYNNDGSLDLLISNFNEKPVLYKNIAQAGNWLKVELEGTLTNRNGFGSIVEIEADGKIYRRYYHGAHFYGQSILPVHFGLDNASEIARLTVYWLSGNTDEIAGIQPNQSIKIKEMEGLITSLDESERGMKFNKSGDLKLMGNYPNPFNGTTHIQFEMNSPGKIQFEVFNVLGQKVYSSLKNYSTPGIKNITWNLSRQNGQSLNTGVYFYRVSHSKFSETGKMHYIK